MKAPQALLLFLLICNFSSGQKSSLLFRRYEHEHGADAAYYYLKDHRKISSLNLELRGGYFVTYGTAAIVAGLTTTLIGLSEQQNYAAERNSCLGCGGPEAPDLKYERQMKTTVAVGPPLILLGIATLGFGIHYLYINNKIKNFERSLQYNETDKRTLRKFRTEATVLHIGSQLCANGIVGAGAILALTNGLAPENVNTTTYYSAFFGITAVFVTGFALQVAYAQIAARKYTKLKLKDL